VEEANPPAPDTSKDAVEESSNPDLSQVDFAVFYHADRPRLERFLRKASGCFNCQDSEDVAQEALTELWRQWGTVNHPYSWVRRVAFRKMIKAVDKKKKEYPAENLAEARDARLNITNIELSRQARDVKEAIHKLPEQQRYVFALRYEGFSSAETAEILGISEANERQLYRRARAQLGKML
jgi:RNA polymerase sigma factor (sigma-70 family)